MRHRKLVDEAGEVDPDRGAAGGRPPIYRVEDAQDLDVVEREFGAVRVLGVAHGGPLTLSDLRGIARKVDDAASGAGAHRAGPTFTVLCSNPYVVAPGRRSYLTCVPVRGAVQPPEGTTVERLDGGLFLVAVSTGGIDALESTYGFLVGRHIPARGHELAHADDPQIRLLFPTPLEDVAKDAQLTVEVAVPVSITMRTDTMRNQR